MPAARSLALETWPLQLPAAMWDSRCRNPAWSRRRTRPGVFLILYFSGSPSPRQGPSGLSGLGPPATQPPKNDSAGPYPHHPNTDDAALEPPNRGAKLKTGARLASKPPTNVQSDVEPRTLCGWLMTKRSTQLTQMETAKDGELAQIVASIHQLATDIDHFPTRTQDNRRHALRLLLQRFYTTICDLSEYKPQSPVSEADTIEADKAVLDAWNALLAPIRALSSWTAIPNGPFLAARMALFVIMAFTFQEFLPLDLPLSDLSRDRVRLQMDFCLTVDEVLLAQLCTIWRESGQKDYFRWATTHLHNVKHCIRTDYNQAAMMALSPTELWQVPGMTGTQKWVPSLDDEPIYKGFEHATVVVFGEPEHEGGRQRVISQTLYSEGPIRFHLNYCLFDDKSEEWLKGPRLWRSMQFVLDARQTIHPWLVQERERLAQKVMEEKLPTELQRLVLGLIQEEPTAHPYLSHLDLPTVFRPFPSLAGACVECEPTTEVAATSSKQATCPHRSIFIWNLALRAFHTFHQPADGEFVMCSHMDVCEGHHDDPAWQVPDQEALQSQVERIIQSRCGASSSIKSVGFGPLGDATGPHEEGALNAWLDLPTYGLVERDSEGDLDMAGAMGLYSCVAINNDRLFCVGNDSEPVRKSLNDVSRQHGSPRARSGRVLPLDTLPKDLDFFAASIGKSSEDYYSQGLRARFRLDAAKVLLQAAKKPEEVKYADIGYEVNEDAFMRRSEARLAGGGLPSAVPSGFPTQMSGPLVWDKDSFPDETEYVYYLTEADKEEIHLALAYFKEQGLDGQEVSRETFPLPNLGKRLEAARNDVYEGRGFAIVRGLDPDVFVVEDLTVVYLGVSSYIAERRVHVILRNDEDQDRQSSEDKPFHTDTVNDCLCLFTQSLAASGGRSVLASAWTVYNELAATRPDLIHVLSQPDWPFDTFGRTPAFYKRALLYHQDEKIIMSFSRRLLVGHAPSELRTAGIPGLTEAQAEALDAVHFIARKHEIKTKMEKGDLRFINNMAILHRREAFANDADTMRHLVRIWLNNELMCWKLPYDLRLAWARVFDNKEGQRHWDLEPIWKDGVDISD
ncbi:hypothetical protein G7Z17_g6838 [Cylindrodendrum hubeiense]|uniref:TauD/TfdA-like domain-containing protein n=1 Tax=Cylindrodendrum hubeiense TaxID=595255 RepID=A0A9P5H8A0_9HYPO|nr:hypothetical protein G7Z17_g6838 [Cylindrodendrum hubeiense]